MLFYTQQFFVFFAIVFALYWLVPWARARVWLLAVASFYFYMSWNARLAALIGISAVIDYIIGLRIDASRSRMAKKALLIVSILWNLGQLAYFKYSNFFLDSLGHLLGAAGISRSLPTLNIILPIGVSFYTFEAISYTVDVYRRRIPAERNLINFVLFITFFPRLIAGPIIRGANFLPQARRKKHWDWPRLQLGANYFLLGLFKKIVIADRMALFSDPVFAHPNVFSTGANWIAVFAYSIQAYCDFSGYSDMAVGLGHALGYKLPQNFRMPYLARNISEFWSRWHISLTSWLRDYLFIPLGGSRVSPLRTGFNITVTMTLCGLWHGAKWTFVIFGALQAVFIIGQHLFATFARRFPLLKEALETPPGTVACTALTLLAFTLSLVIFRSPTLHNALIIFSELAGRVRGPGIPQIQPLFIFWWLAALVLAGHLLTRAGVWQRLLLRSPAIARGCIYATAFSCSLLLAPDAGKAFIYFQF